MTKGTFKGSVCMLCLLVILALGGCADAEILSEIMQTIAVETAAEQDVAESKEEAATVGAVVEEETPNFLYEEGCCYAYLNLNEAEQIWYRNIAEGLGGLQEKVRLDKAGIEQGLNETDIDRIFQCVLADHPELFYVEGYTYTKYNRGEKIVAIEFSGTFSMPEEKLAERLAEIEQEVRPVLEGAADFSDDYDKVKYVYDTLITNTEYDLTAPDNQNIYSVFVNGKSVCQGYAKAMQYLLERMGVECTLVQGTVDTGEGHAWNLVKVNGSYYYVDVTWGDASYLPNEDGEYSDYLPEINYDYLCVTTGQLLRTHILNSYVPMPACVDEKDNYYVREGAFFTTYDAEQMKQLFEKLNRGEKQEITVKCSDAECFNRIASAMIEEQEVFDYLQGDSNTIAYTQNEKQLSMSFWVTNE